MTKYEIDIESLKNEVLIRLKKHYQPYSPFIMAIAGDSEIKPNKLWKIIKGRVPLKFEDAFSIAISMEKWENNELQIPNEKRGRKKKVTK